jgi:hypothetical protein
MMGSAVSRDGEALGAMDVVGVVRWLSGALSKVVE